MIRPPVPSLPGGKSRPGWGNSEAVRIGLGALLSASIAYSAEAAPGGRPRGPALGLQFASDLLSTGDPTPGGPPTELVLAELGAGAGFSVEYRFAPRLICRLGVHSALHYTSGNDIEATRSAASLEALYLFRTTSRIEPYLMIGLGATGIEFMQSEITSSTSGDVASLGVGLLHHFGPMLAFDLALIIDQINWSEVEVRGTSDEGASIEFRDPVEEAGGAARLRLGFRFAL